MMLANGRVGWHDSNGTILIVVILSLVTREVEPDESPIDQIAAKVRFFVELWLSWEKAANSRFVVVDTVASIWGAE